MKNLVKYPARIATKELSCTPLQQHIPSNASPGAYKLTNLVKKATILTVLLVMGVTSLKAATYYSKTNGYWNAKTTWSNNPSGNPTASTYPKAGDVVNISGYIVTLSANAECATIVNSGTITCSTYNLTTTGTITNTGTITIGTGTMAATGAITNTSGTISLSTGTLTASKGLTNGTVKCSGAATITVGTTGGFTPVSFTCGTSTVNFTGTTQSIGGLTYYNLSTPGAGTKTLQGAATVTNALTLPTSGTGLLSLGDFDLTSASIVGGCSSFYVNTSGTGYLRCTGKCTTYPIGVNAVYNPVTVSSPGDSLAVRASTATMSKTNLLKYWSVIGSLDAGLTMTFQYQATDVNGTESNYKVWFDDTTSGVDWAESPTTSTINITGNTFSFAPSSAQSVSGDWTLDVNPLSKQWYAYQNGDWGAWRTWTLDASGTTLDNTGNDIPAAIDYVTILNGKTVTISSGSKTIANMTIEDGGALDMGATSGHSFNNVDGQGILKLSSSNLDLPAASGSFFQAGGGTVEYNGTGTIPVFSDFTFNNLVVNMQNTTDLLTCVGSKTTTINGYLTVKKGILKINSNSATTSLTINVGGDVTIESTGSIKTGTGTTEAVADSAHRLIIGGDFTNNGTADFSNLTAADYINYPTNGRVDVVFNNASADQDVIINGVTKFYRIEITKGTDQTYVLNIDATAANLFYLYGRNTEMASTDVTTVNNTSALGLLAGTVRLGANITIPSLAEEPTSGNDYCYLIDDDACLWVDGASVTMTTNYNSGDPNSLVVYGKIKVTNQNSVLIVNDLHGIVLRRSSVIVVENGSLSTPCIRTSVASGTHRGALLLSGGTLTITGNLSGSDEHASLSMTYPGMSFKMSGDAQMTINQACDGSGVGAGKILVIGADAANCAVTGGTVKLVVANRDANFTSTAPFWNLIIDASSTTYSSSITSFTAGSGSVAVTAQPLVVFNDFNLTNSAKFSSSGQNVTVGGDFSIATGATYTPGSNTTTLDGTSEQLFTAAGTISGNLYNLTINDSADVELAGKSITVRNDLAMGSGSVLRDGGYTISVAGDVANNGTHYKPASGAGSIILNGSSTQTISGTGTFNNLTLNHTVSGGTVAAGNLTLTGDLRLAGKGTSGTPERLNLGSYKLSLGVSSGIYSDLNTAKSFSQHRMILTSGLMSDGGVSKAYADTVSFRFPFGFLSGSTPYYQPATIKINDNPATYGTVTTRPVNARHPLAQSTSSLACYWRTVSSGFSGVPSMLQTYEYNNAFIYGDESQYKTGRYYEGAWIQDTRSYNYSGNTAVYGNGTVIDGDYTAGIPATFASVPALYSVADGAWSTPGTWSKTRNGTSTSDVPSSGTRVYVCDNHTVTVTADGAMASSITIAEGSVLDLGTFTGHSFTSLEDSIPCTGTLRISSSGYFPQGDLGNFLELGGGTVEYYTSSGNIVLPTSSAGTGLVMDHYNNLKLTHSGAYTITLPNSNLEVYRDLILKSSGSASGQIQTNNSAAHTITVDSTLCDSSGTFLVRNSAIQTINIMGDAYINSGAKISVESGSTSHALNLYGNLENNGTLSLAAGYVASSFKGAADAAFSGSGTSTFYSLTVDKGTDTTSVLNVTSTGTITSSQDPAVTLTNGTFLWNNPSSFAVSKTAAFPIPSTACLSIMQGTLNAATTSSSNLGLSLQGKLEVIGGTMNVGTSSISTIHNDVEYAAAGSPTIHVDNTGILNVYGLIRRSTNVTQGALSYTQRGNSTVTIFGTGNITPARAALEICNDSSYFAMSGNAKLTISSATVGTTFGDLYLRPDSSAVSGGTITFLTARTYTMDASCHLNNLTIGNSSTATIVKMTGVNPLVLDNSLLITASATFACGTSTAQYNDLYIGGDFTNQNSTTAASFIPYSNVTTFNGSGTQTYSSSITTSTTYPAFYNLVIDKSAGILTITSPYNIIITYDLNIESGIFDNNAANVFLYGDFTNNATHIVSTFGTYIFFNGSSRQYIYGNGTGQFGNIGMNNKGGVYLNADATVNGNIFFNSANSFLYIDDNLLTLSVNANYSGATTNRCIITNGVISDAGVKKIFASGTKSFTYPVGVNGKYTPVTYTAASTGGGSITVKPVNAAHPAQTSPSTANELQYYWNVTGSMSGLTSITHTYNYLQADVEGSDDSYVGARYYGGTWTKSTAVPATVNATTNVIGASAVSFIDGDYTCGENDNFNEKYTYYSRTGATNITTTTGADWSSLASWTTDPDHDGDEVTEVPNGNSMVIKAGHVITVSNNDQYAYSVVDSGIINLKSTSGHNLGFVSGPGRIIIENSTAGLFVFPGGNYDGFMSDTCSTVEYNGVNALVSTSVTTSFCPNIKTYQNLEFTGTDLCPIYLPNVNITVKNNLKISGAQVLNTNYNKNIILWGNWVDEVASGFIPGTGMVSFEGNENTTVTATGTENFYKLKINKTLASDRQVLLSPVTVSKALYLTKGRFITSAEDILTISTTSTSAVTGGSDSSFVDGPLAKNISSGSYFTFPVGNGTRYGKIYISAASAAGYWDAQYFNANPKTSLAYTSYSSPLTSISDNEYWKVGRPTTNPYAKIRLRYDALSYPAVNNSSLAQSYLRVVEHNSSGVWTLRGQTVSTSAKTVATSALVSTEDYYFTLGLAGVTARLTSATVSDICNNGAIASIPVELTGNPNWSLTYKVTNTSTRAYKTFSIPGITATSTNLTLTGTDLASIATSDATTLFTVSLVSVTDASGATGICAIDTTQFSLLLTYTPDITGTFTVGTSEIRSYATTSHAASYAWSWSGIISGTLSGNPASVTTTTTTGTYTLSVTETTTTTSCTASDVQEITVQNTPAPAITPATSNVCQGSSVTYSTPFVTGHYYTWTVSNGTCTGCGTSATDSSAASISVTWNTAGSSSITVKEGTSSTYGVSTTDTNAYEVSPSITGTDTVTLSTTELCAGNTAVINVSGSQSNIDYTLRNDATDATIITLSGSGSALDFSTVPASTITYNVLASNQGCSVELPGTPTVTVNTLPAITTQPVNDTCFVGTGTCTFSVAATGSNLAYQWQMLNASSWEDLSDASPYSGTTTGTLTITSPTAAIDGAQYRCIVSGTCTPSQTSDTVSARVIYEFYSNGNDVSQTSNWGTNTDGTGTNPPSFDITGAIFHVSATQTVPATSNWAIGSGVTIDVNGVVVPAANVVVSGAGTISGTGTLEVTRTTGSADFGSQYTISTVDLSTLTIKYAVLAGGQGITANTYSTLILANTSGTNTALGTFSATTLTNASGGTLDALGFPVTATTVDNTSSTIRFAGSTNGFATTTGTIEYYGSSAQSVAGGTYNNLTFSGGGLKTLSAAATVTGVLTLTSGIVKTDATNLLTLEASASIAGTPSHTSFISGPLRHTVASTASTTKSFPVGTDSLHLAEITVVQANATTTYYTCEYTHSSARLLSTTLPSDNSLKYVSDVGYWHFSKSNESLSSDGLTDANLTSAKATLYYLPGDYVTNTTNLRVAKSNTATNKWINVGNTAIGTSSITSEAFYAFCDVSLATCVCSGEASPLPISLVSFGAIASGKDVNITWETASETDNDYFLVEKSLDGKSFSSIKEVDGAGTSTETHNYSVTDKDVGVGTIYYRLKQVDLDGKFTYSDIASVQIKGSAGDEKIVIYPNPSSNDNIKLLLNCSVAQVINICISNVLGQTLFCGGIEAPCGTFILYLNELCELPAGSYNITVTSNNNASTKQFVVQ